jgi:hypothetical protein
MLGGYVPGHNQVLDLKSERVRAWMALVREKGQRFGRPRRDIPVENISDAFNRNLSIRGVARTKGALGKTGAVSGTG